MNISLQEYLDANLTSYGIKVVRMMFRRDFLESQHFHVAITSEVKYANGTITFDFQVGDLELSFYGEIPENNAAAGGMIPERSEQNESSRKIIRMILALCVVLAIADACFWVWVFHAPGQPVWGIWGDTEDKAHIVVFRRGEMPPKLLLQPGELTAAEKHRAIQSTPNYDFACSELTRRVNEILSRHVYES